MNQTATVHDISLAQLRKMRARRGTGDDQPQAAAGVFTDMADGILALDFALSFADFEHDSRKLVLSVVGLLADKHDALAMFDEQLAEHLKCSVRTVRNWRSDYIKRSPNAQSFGVIEITEGEYDHDKQRFQPTQYRLNADVRLYVERCVTEARSSNLYERDRRKAIEQAALDHYEDIPDAPPVTRNKKPGNATVRLERDFINARKNLAKGQRTLGDLPEHRRADFLAGAQGEEVRALLLQMQAEIAGLLQGFPQTVDDEDLNDIPAKFAGIPPPCRRARSDRRRRRGSRVSVQRKERRYAAARRRSVGS
jgi:hypothetical protein